jgi:hypothetical protein
VLLVYFVIPFPCWASGILYTISLDTQHCFAKSGRALRQESIRGIEQPDLQ